MQWIVFSLVTALSACEDEVVQVNFPADASPDRAEGGSSRNDAGAAADGDAAGPAADAAALDESLDHEVDAQTGDEPDSDDGGENAGD